MNTTAQKAANRLAEIERTLERVRKKGIPARSRYILFKSLLSLLEASKAKDYPPGSSIVQTALAFVRSPNAVEQFRKDYLAFKRWRKAPAKLGPNVRFGGGRLFGSGSRYTPVDRLAARVG